MKSVLTRRFWVWVHRCAGLYMAVFLTAAGLTGAILAFDPQINRWLNPDLLRVETRTGPTLDPYTLRERALAEAPGSRMNFVIWNQAPGDPFVALLEPPPGATGAPGADTTFVMLYLDPYTGNVLGRDSSAAWPLTRRSFIRFTFAIHAALFCGGTGVLLMGTAALVWTFDCFIGLGLTFPRPVPSQSGDAPRGWWSRWSASWRFVFRGRPYRVAFNFHRAAGLWTWGLLLVFAVSSVAFNLPQLYQPVMRRLFHSRNRLEELPNLPAPIMDPGLDWRTAASLGRRHAMEESRRRGIELRDAQGELYFSYDPMKGVFAYQAHCARDVGSHAPGITVYFDGKTGEYRGADFATGENAGASFTSWITAIHGATVWGCAGRLLAATAGLATAGLSISGVYLWLKRILRG